MFEILRQDVARYGPDSRHPLWTAWTHPGLWATAAYRLVVWTRAPERGGAGRVLGPLASALQALARMATHVDLAPEAAIGPGLYLPHAGFVIVGPGSRVGANCTLAPGSVLGHAGGRADPGGEPEIGDRVYVGPGAKLVGPIHVGDDALVGIGAVVTASIPPRGVVAGNPARLLHEGGAFAVLRYPGMESDLARQASLAKASPPS